MATNNIWDTCIGNEQMGTVLPTSAINMYPTTTGNNSGASNNQLYNQYIQAQQQYINSGQVFTIPVGGGITGPNPPILYPNGLPVQPLLTYPTPQYQPVPATPQWWTTTPAMPFSLPPATGRQIEIKFTEPDGGELMIQIDEAFEELFNLISHKHAAIYAKNNFMDKGEFSPEEMERAGDLIEEIASERLAANP